MPARRRRRRRLSAARSVVGHVPAGSLVVIVIIVSCRYSLTSTVNVNTFVSVISVQPLRVFIYFTPCARKSDTELPYGKIWKIFEHVVV